VQPATGDWELETGNWELALGRREVTDAKQDLEEIMSHIRRIDHVAIVVDDIEAALGFWRDGLGLELTHVEDVPDQESVVAFLPTGDSEVELR
jgi:catechol-2,3-dioxygenase